MKKGPKAPKNLKFAKKKKNIIGSYYYIKRYFFEQVSKQIPHVISTLLDFFTLSQFYLFVFLYFSFIYLYHDS